jgi:CheY-like chemotaxis protein
VRSLAGVRKTLSQEAAGLPKLFHLFEKGYNVVANTDYRLPPGIRLDGASGPTTRQNDPGLQVLVVEDEPDTAASTALLLRLYGHRVQVAHDGPAALRAAQSSPPEVVLLDLGLPGMDGWQVAQRLQEQAAWKKPLLIAVTGYGRRADRLRSQQAGIHLHLVKPVDPDFLRRLLQRFQTLREPGEGEQDRPPRYQRVSRSRGLALV